ncbi:hypothetical protein Fmac_020141 [Flemingia macrophylla]|uniref:Uncharacterized protein n=1 Tax=Flemingia macrophylla TaxID=520843 RepID=A0ABD1M9X7_9FABA
MMLQGRTFNITFFIYVHLFQEKLEARIFTYIERGSDFMVKLEHCFGVSFIMVETSLDRVGFF